MRHIFFLGFWGPTGGANTEAYHTVKMWRKAGWEVTMIPTWGAQGLSETVLDQAKTLSVNVVSVKNASELHTVPKLAGSFVIAMCNSRATAALPFLRKIGCRMVWVPCMNVVFPNELPLYREVGLPDWVVYQSRYQYDQLQTIFGRLPTFSRMHPAVIPGAFDSLDFPFSFHARHKGDDFVIGRLARYNQDKWSPYTVPICDSVQPADGGQRKALFMAVNEETHRVIGRPNELPSWVTCLPTNAISSREFFSRIHALICINSTAVENWPRVGLEAMSSGVPLVVENNGGWPEMVKHGETGFLCESPAEFPYYLQELTCNDAYREKIALNAAQRCQELTNPDNLLPLWNTIFKELES